MFLGILTPRVGRIGQKLVGLFFEGMSDHVPNPQLWQMNIILMMMRRLVIEGGDPAFREREGRHRNVGLN